MRISNTKSGYTLVELMIAMVVAAIMFSGIYMVSLQTLNMLRMTRDESRASNACQYQMEKLRSQTWMSLLTMEENTTFSSSDNAALGYLRNGAGYVKRTDEAPAGVSNAPLLAISVTVEWTGFDSTLQSKTLTSAVTKRGMLK